MIRRLLVVALVAITSAFACNPKIDRPAPRVTRPGPEMSTTSAEHRDTLFARAVAAVKGRGYTEISLDQPHWQVRAKSPARLSVLITLTALGDSTKVSVQATGEPRTAGLDTDAMATVLTLMSDIAPPPAKPANPGNR